VKVCHGCGQTLPERVERGGLVVQRNPSAVFWKGEQVEMKPALASMLRLFVRFGHVSHEALDTVHCGTAVKTKWDMLGRLRKALAAVTDEVKIKNVWGWGYRIEISE
jgi:DNA-binding response OmpR family regulator